MKKIYLFFVFFIAFPLFGQVLISPLDAMKSNFSNNSEIEEKNILLKSEEFATIQKNSQVKLTSKIFKIFIAREGADILGYGILMNRKIRSQNGVVLYLITNDSKLKSIEVIAFNEPLEYLPTKKWNEQFSATSTEKNLYLGDDIATITGATLSARTITDGSRVAFAFYNTMLKTN